MNYRLTFSQVYRDIDAILEQWGVPDVLGDSYNVVSSAVSRGVDKQALQRAVLIKAQNWPVLICSFEAQPVTAASLHAVADALDTLDHGVGRKSHFQMYTPTCRNIVKSYYAAVEKLHRENFADGEGLLYAGEEDPTIPTVAQVKAEFVGLFVGQDKLPAEFTIRQTLKRLGLPRHKALSGRPVKFATK